MTSNFFMAVDIWRKDREEQLILGGGEYRSTSEEKDLNEDPYFVRNYKPHRKV